MKIGAWDSDSGAVFVIAEAGINHNGVMGDAFRLIEAAKAAGADAVKFQWFNVDALVARRGPSAAALRPYEFGLSHFPGIAAHCRDVGITFLCSVFDPDSAAAYLALDPPAVKIGSGELRELSLIEQVAKAGKPMILSTGMATMQEVKRAWIATGFTEDRALLHCVSAYPAPLDQVNLRAMDALKEFGCPVGFSDHTIGNGATAAAVARGACIIEKHLTLHKALPGPDHAASATPQEFARLVAYVRDATMMLGHGRKEVLPCEAATLKAIGR